MGFGKKHRPFDYMTQSFQDAVYTALERSWQQVHGRAWKKHYVQAVGEITKVIRQKREEETKLLPEYRLCDEY